MIKSYARVRRMGKRLTLKRLPLRPQEPRRYSLKRLAALEEIAPHSNDAWVR